MTHCHAESEEIPWPSPVVKIDQFRRQIAHSRIDDSVKVRFELTTSSQIITSLWLFYRFHSVHADLEAILYVHGHPRDASVRDQNIGKVSKKLFFIFNLKSLFHEAPLRLHSSVELPMVLLLNIIWWVFRLFQDHNKKVKVYLNNYPRKLLCYRMDRPEMLLGDYVWPKKVVQAQ